MNLINLNKLTIPVKASIAFMLGSILNQIVNLVTTPIFTRILSETDYGIINLYQAWFSILSIVLTLGLTGATYNSAMIDFNEDIDTFTSALMGLITSVLAVFFIVYIFIDDTVIRILGIPKTLVNIMGIHILLNSAISIWLQKQKFSYKYKLSIVLNFSIIIIGAICSYVFVQSLETDKAIGKVIGTLMGTIPIGMCVYIGLLTKGKKIINFKYWSYALRNSIAMVPHYLSNTVLVQSDRIIIGQMVGIAEAGLYGIAYMASTAIGVIAGAINASWLPWTFQRMQEKEYAKIGKAANALVLMIAILSLIFIIFSPEFIMLIAAPNYYEAIWVMPPVIIGTYFSFVYTLFGNIELYHKRTKLIMSGSIGAAIINIALNIVCIPKFGYIAAAYTTLISYIILSLLHYKLMCKIEKNKIYNVKYISIVSMIFTIIGISSSILYNYWEIKYILVVVLVIILFFNRKKIIKIISKTLSI